jgi:hypothetical protein
MVRLHLQIRCEALADRADHHGDLTDALHYAKEAIALWESLGGDDTVPAGPELLRGMAHEGRMIGYERLHDQFCAPGEHVTPDEAEERLGRSWRGRQAPDDRSASAPTQCKPSLIHVLRGLGVNAGSTGGPQTSANDKPSLSHENRRIAGEPSNSQRQRKDPAPTQG